MIKRLAIASLFVLGSSTGFAQETDTIEELASSEEIEMVNAELAKINCVAPEVEKESATLFEVDDATCDIGQYDIKLNGEYKIWVMTLDE